jgi:hypothetical protein
MRTVIHIFRLVIFPLFVMGFLVVGWLAMLFSAFVEYITLDGLLDIPEAVMQRIDIPDVLAGLLPLFVVIILEGSKVALHFYTAAIAAKKDSLTTMRSRKPFLTALKHILTGFSVLCTIFYCANIFTGAKPDLEKKNKADAEATYLAALEKIDADPRYKDEEDRINMEYNKKIDEINEARKREQDRYMGNGPKTYARATEVKAIAIAGLDKRETEAVTRRDEDLAKIKSEKQQEKVNAQETRAAAVDKAEERNNNDANNQYLHTFLLYIANMFGLDKYHYSIYSLTVLVLSGFLAVILELLINASQSMTTTPKKELEEAFEDKDSTLTEAERQHYARILNLCIRTLMALVFSIVSYAVVNFTLSRFTRSQITYDRGQLGLAVVSIVISIVVFQFVRWKFGKTDDAIYKALTNKNSKACKNIASAERSITADLGVYLLQGTISFALLLILSIFFEDNLTSLEAFPIALGTAFSAKFGVKQFKIAELLGS